MTTPSLDSDSPPAQATRAEIRTWHTEGYKLRLEDTGANGAAVIYTQNAGDPELVGRIWFDPVQDRHFVEWNQAGHRALEDYKRNHWDTKFYYTMAEWMRS